MGVTRAKNLTNFLRTNFFNHLLMSFFSFNIKKVGNLRKKLLKFFASVFPSILKQYINYDYKSMHIPCS